MVYTQGKKGADRFYFDNGDPICPPNDGFVGDPKKQTMQKGLILDRYGTNNKGSYLSPQGTSIEKRALDDDSKNVYTYKVIKEFEALEGITAPWFGKAGGGIQYKLPQKIYKMAEFLQEVGENDV